MARKLQVEIIGDASSYQRALGQAGKASDSLGSKMARVGKIAGAGLAVGIGLATIAMKKSFDAAIEAEKAQTKLDTALKSVGGTAKQHAAAMATVGEVSRKAALDDEDLMDSLSSLTRVTKDATSAQDALSVAADLARGRGIELSAATGIVQKAMLGNLGALKRIGIEIPKVTAAQDALKESNTKATAEQVKAAKAADETATRQGALAALQKQYAGASEAYGNTAAGAQDRFRVAVENLQEALGKKLLPVFATVAEWVTENMPAIETVVTTVTGGIGTAFTELARIAEKEWPRIKAAAEAVANWYRDNLEPTFTSVTRNIALAFDKAGIDSKASVERNFGAMPPLVKMLMQNTLSIVNAALAVLRGDWAEAWNQVKVIPGRALTAVIDTLRVFKGVANAAAKALGDAVIAGVKAGLSPLVDYVRERMGQLKGAISSAAGAVYGAAVAVGRQIVQGIGAGMDALKDWLWQKAKDLAKGAVKAAADAIIPGSPSKLSAMMVGEPIAQGIAKGMADKQAEVNNQASKTSRAAVKAAADAVKEGRSEYRNAWRDYVSESLGAFDEVAGKLLTKSEKLIADLAAKQTQQAPKVELTEAAAALDTAKLSAAWNKVILPDETVDEWLARVKAANEELAAAQQRYDTAKLAVQAQNERAALNQRITADRTNFQQWLASRTVEQQQALIQEGKGQEAIVTKINSYGPDYRAAGKKLGDAIARGLRDAAGGVVDAANELAAAIAKALGVASQVGKKAADTAGDRLKEIERRQMGGPVRAGTPYIVGERGPEIFWPGLSGAVIPNANTAGAAGGLGGGITVNVYGSVTAERDLAETLRVELMRTGRYNAGGVLGGLA